MLAFMVLGPPRSGTTWAANWLTTDKVICYHDPLYRFGRDRLDSLDSDKMMGVSCSGLSFYQDYVINHPARKVVLHRDAGEVNRSLDRIGLPPMPEEWFKFAYELKVARHVDWKALFDPTMARDIYEFLTGLPFDPERHAELVQMNVQPAWTRLELDPAAATKFVEDLTALVKKRSDQWRS